MSTRAVVPGCTVDGSRLLEFIVIDVFAGRICRKASEPLDAH
jgi:hypothetical protein